MTRKRPIGTWQRTLASSRIVLRPAEFLTSLDALMLEPAALGILIRLMAYAVGGGLPSNRAALARLARVPHQTLRRWWPDLERFFDRDTKGNWTLKLSEWFALQTVSVDRQRLRHLLERLVAYWGNACVYCGTEEGQLQIEHIVPVVRGGTDDLTNLTLACGTCNLKKRTQTAAEFGHPHIHDLASRIQ